MARWFTPYLPAVVGVLGAYTALLMTGTPFLAVLVYSVYFAAAVVLPGTLVYRRIAGYSDSLLADFAWGSVTGLMLELVGWAAFTAAGANRYLWLWPALILLTFALVPSLRPQWRRPAACERTSPLVAWATTISSLLAYAYLASIYYQANQLPPKGGGYFVDLPWHLGVAYEATRTIALRVPEATAEGILHYHWFADAHFGAASLISGVDLPTIVIRTGLFPLTFVLVATTVSLAVKISRRPLVGALAAIIVVSTTAGAEYWTRLYKMHVVFPESPTGMYSVGVSCLVLAQLVDFARGQRLTKAQWGLFAATAVAAVGSKPSIILLFIPAVCLVLALQLLRRQPLNRTLVAALAVMSVVFVISVFVFASPGGSTVRPSLIQVLVWKGTAGVQTPTAILALTALVKGYLLFATAAVALTSQHLRADPAAHLLGAASLVGFVAAWVLYHPGLSQVFFWTSAIPFAAILSAWGLALALGALAPRRQAVATFIVLTSGALLASMVVSKLLTDQRSRVLWGWLALITTAAGITLVGYRLRMPLRGGLLMAAMAAMALSIPATLIALPWQPGPSRSNPRWFAQSQAASWIEANTPLHDLLATNSHCLGPNRPNCDARSFWLSGFGGRRVLLGGYGVSPAALRRSEVNGIKAWRQPYHDQQLLQLNDSAFQAPTVEALQRLYHDYGVRWLVADRYSSISPSLARLTHLRYENEWIEIYQLDPVLLDTATR